MIGKKAVNVEGASMRYAHGTKKRRSSVPLMPQYKSVGMPIARARRG